LFSQLTLISTGQIPDGSHFLPAVSFSPETNMYLIVWITHEYGDSGKLFARYLPSRAFAPPEASSYLQQLDTGDRVSQVDVACGANTGKLPNNRTTGDCLVTWALRHDNAFWSFGRQLTIVAGPVSQLYSHETGFFGPLQNLGALSAWGTAEPAIGVAAGPENFCPAFIGFDGNGVKRAYSRMSTVAEKKGWKSVAAGDYHSLGIRADGSLWAWGKNSDGQLGRGDTKGRNEPVRVGSWSDWVTVTAGFGHSLGIRENGSLWAWGDNWYGQLGNADDTHKYSPYRVGSWKDWVAVRAGGSHSLGIRADGSLWAWGKNSDGQLGTGDITPKYVPVQVGSWKDWVSMSAGVTHSLGIRANGSLYAWGRGDNGALGLNGVTQAFVPTQVGGMYDWKSVSAGGLHSLGIRGNDLMYGWGFNGNGQLGVGNVISSNLPVKVGIWQWNYWRSVDAGYFHTLGIDENSRLWAWGLNVTGELGLGDTEDRNTPTRVGSRNDWLMVSAGNQHSLGIRADGSLWAWGMNTWGQLGLGDNEDRSTPTQVLLPKKFPWPMFLPAIISGRK
jgi:alpha-tubulin suppressor-like RCC1 family protein